VLDKRDALDGLDRGEIDLVFSTFTESVGKSVCGA
jgi:hypothetical protein